MSLPVVLKSDLSIAYPKLHTEIAIVAHTEILLGLE